MSNQSKLALLDIAEAWPLGHLNDYIKNLEIQVSEIRELVNELKRIQRKKQKEVNRKIRDTGPRGAA